MPVASLLLLAHVQDRSSLAKLGPGTHQITGSSASFRWPCAFFRLAQNVQNTLAAFAAVLAVLTALLKCWAPIAGFALCT